MRVLQLIDSLDAGGAERVAVTYANALSLEIDRSFLCTTRKEGLLKDSLNDEVEYLFLRKKHALDLKAIIKLLKFIKRNDITIIHAHATSFFTATFVKILCPRLVLIWHDHYGQSEMLEYRKYKILKKCSKKFRAIISVNKELESWAKERLSTNEVHFLRNAASLTPGSKKERLMLKGDSGKRLVCLANFRPQKDHQNLIAAFRIVVQKHPDYSLHLFGQNWNDDYFKEVKRLMNRVELKGAVHYYGSHSSVYNILKQSDIGVLSSRSEGLPLTLLEYGVAEIAVVCTNVGQCSDVLSGYGQIVEPMDHQQLAEAINHYIENPVEMKKQASAFHEHIENCYSLKEITAKLVSIYRSCK